jgi:hypothetical protein
MTTCPFQLRTGPCQLNEDHRGRHTTVAYYCDSCGQMRRSRPVAQALNPWDGVVEATFCFMCVTVREAESSPRL